MMFDAETNLGLSAEQFRSCLRAAHTFLVLPENHTALNYVETAEQSYGASLDDIMATESMMLLFCDYQTRDCERVLVPRKG